MTRLPSLVLPSGDLRYLYLHWTAGDYATAYPAYHVCVTLAGGLPAVVQSNDVLANARDVREPGPPYAAHTSGRNSYAIGVAVCGMRDATPHDFGAYPLREDLLDLTCAAAARLCAAYAIPIDEAHVRTHAEAAVEDGYFGCGDDERWDVARLVPSGASLDARDAAVVGAVLRARIAAA
jgi:hypothetical protein